MGFSKMIELLQEKEKGKIILVNAGSFYIARGKDAILLHNILDLKLSCLEIEVCKVGFPINSLEKYTNLIEEKNYSYIVYNFDNELSKLKIIKKYDGKNINHIEENRCNCYICSNTVKMYKKHDRYVQAVVDLFEEEKQSKEAKVLEKNVEEKRIIKWTRKKKKKIN